MAAEVQRGRYTADIDGDFVVFLIGMRLNHPLRIRKWWPVAAAMPKMLKVLSQHPELGCLGFQQWFGRTTILVQYWRDFDSLDRFAYSSTRPLRPGSPAPPTRPRVPGGVPEQASAARPPPVDWPPAQHPCRSRSR